MVNKDKLYYQRKENVVFTMEELRNQLIVWAKENRRAPEAIVLPVEEYFCYLGYLLWPPRDPSNLSFCGISLEISYEDQKVKFVF